MTDDMNVRYRRMPFQIKYKKDLDIIESSEATMLRTVNHFARNGYENLYLMQNGTLFSVVTLDDFLSGEWVSGLNREFIQELNNLHTNEEIISFFIDHPYAKRDSKKHYDSALHRYLQRRTCGLF